MIHDTEILQYVYKTADMGCEGIQSVLEHAKGSSLKNELEDQYKEYQKIRRRAHDLLEERNEQPKGIGSIAKISSDIMSAGKMMTNPTDSKIAEMAIEGNQTGINKTVKHLNDYSGEDSAVHTLTKKLLATEESNAEQLKKFL